MNKFVAFHYFVTACEQGNFTAAAQKLGTSASTVTKMIGRLEDDLGTRLFNRTTRRLFLTDQGQALFERAQRILSDLGEAESVLRQATKSTTGTVRIVVPFLFGRLTLVPALPGFFERFPEVKLQVHFSDRPVDLIEAGFDVGVHTGDLADSAAIRRLLTHGPRITAAAPDYLERSGIPAVPEDLLKHNCIHGRFGLDWFFRSATGGRQRLRVGGNLAVYNGDALREAAVKGLGVVQSSWWALRNDIDRGTLIPVLREYEVEGPPVSIVYPSGRHLPARVRALIDYLVEVTAAGRGDNSTKSRQAS
jgi:DNA-binding transcriptional LysR family regulator